MTAAAAAVFVCRCAELAKVRRTMQSMRTSRTLLLGGAVAVLAACTGCTMWKEKPATSWSRATAGEHFERLMWRHVQHKEWTEFERHLAPNFVSLDANGTHDRAAFLESVKAVGLTDYTLGDFNTQTNGPDMTVTYTVQMRGTIRGQPLPPQPMQMMTVWQQVNKGWVAIAHSEARAERSR